MDSLLGQNLDETIPENFYQAAMLATVGTCHREAQTNARKDITHK
jgi:hypothetical protein